MSFEVADEDCICTINLLSGCRGRGRRDVLGSEWMSKRILFPVAMCSPVFPFPSCPFSALPNAYTITYSIKSSMGKDKENVPFPSSVKAKENETPAPTLMTFCFVAPRDQGPSTSFQFEISGQGF